MKFEVKVPAFPNSARPTQDEWVPYLAAEIGKSDEDLYLIGHSIGCITILRYLETLSPADRVGGVIFVAGFTDYISYEELKSFFQTPIDFGKIKTRPKNGFVAIHSTDDPYVDLKYGEIFKKELGAEVIIVRNKGHFSGPIDEEKSCTELAEVVESVEKMAH